MMTATSKKQACDYQEFLSGKTQLGMNAGFDPLWMPDFLMDFQHSLDDWAIRKGRAAILADCGLGKTPMGLVWAQNIVQKTNRPVLVMTPLAVAEQFVREGEKFGIPIHHSRDGKHSGKSWARGLRKPSDLGFNDARFVLPPLNYNHHVVEVPFIPDGEMFARPAKSLVEQKDERKRSVRERCEKVADLVDHDRPAIVWCHLNIEGNLLAELIPGAVQVAGCDTLEEKERRLNDFAMGRERVLITKPKIGAWGLNLQHCGDMTTFPSHSFEQFYQSVRRCWRFGREGPVNMEIVSALGESAVIAGMKHKQDKAERMFQSLVEHMNHATHLNSIDQHKKTISLPNWLNSGSKIEDCQPNFHGELVAS